VNKIIQKEIAEMGKERKDNGKGTANCLSPCNVANSVVLFQGSFILCRGGSLAHQTQAKEL